MVSSFFFSKKIKRKEEEEKKKKGVKFYKGVKNKIKKVNAKMDYLFLKRRE
jgi:hypothetical protein